MLREDEIAFENYLQNFHFVLEETGQRISSLTMKTAKCSLKNVRMGISLAICRKICLK